MILDSLAQSSTYAALSPRFAAAFAFLRQMTPEAALGRHEVQGDEVFALVQHYATKPLAGRQFEAHRRYIDIQYVFRGSEMMYWAPLPLLTDVTMPFDEKKDAALFALIAHPVAVPVAAGQFTIFFPADGHIPGCSWDEPGDVIKVVMKVLV